MPLSIMAEWERLESGSDEERACFAAVGIFAGNEAFTEAEDVFVKRLRSSVHLSAYKLAEWFAWNWWRLRWEPFTNASDWAMAHRMTTIGGGYVWPNIRIISDGERIVVVAKPTKPRAVEPLRYLADVAVVFRAIEFEKAIDRFVQQVQGQLRAEKVAETNLDKVWSDVVNERVDVAIAKRRRMEALLGFEPDEADAGLLDRLEREAIDLGESAVREMAAMSAGRGFVPTAGALRESARHNGFDLHPEDVVRLQKGTPLSGIGTVPAWRRGAEAARALRAQQRLDGTPISNDLLAKMSGVAASVFTDDKRGEDLSFAIDELDGAARIVLRSKWETGRRFDLARLLGDRIAGIADGSLSPATRTATYRQKLQRSFAAEFLCPIETAEDILGGDYSDDRQEEVADHFNVSPLTVRTLLVNRGRIPREDLGGDFEPLWVA